MRVLGIIPARGGSKGVPRKNIKLLCGKPLLAYTIESALNAQRLTRTILSTEDEEIARVGTTCGIEVPFLRPASLSGDDSPTLPVVQHALEALEYGGDEFDAVCLLQPTNPLRRATDIDNCIDLLEGSEADAVVSVLPVPAEYNPFWAYWKDESGNLRLALGGDEPISRRQELPPSFHREGSVYVTRTEVIRQGRSLYGKNLIGYEIPSVYSSNIDTEADWRKIEDWMSKRIKNEKIEHPRSQSSALLG